LNLLQPILDRYPRDCQSTGVEPLGSAGGLSGAQFWRLATPRGTLGLRRWPIEHPTPDGLRLIHAVLRHATDHGIDFLPLPIATTEGDTFISHGGHLWELAPWLPGSAGYEQSPSVAKLRAAMQALAHFHLAVADFKVAATQQAAGAAPAVVARLTRLRELQVGGVDSLARAITDSHWPDLAPLARRFVANLPHVVPRAIHQLAPLADEQFALQPCVRDVWHDHLLFDGDRVTGLIDFGAMQIDTVATDVARLLGSLVDDDQVGLHDGLATYAALRPLSDEEVAAVSALDASGTILAGTNWIRWIYVDRRQFENERLVVDRFERNLSRLTWQ
jgi:homoserine kinase type II